MNSQQHLSQPHPSTVLPTDPSLEQLRDVLTAQRNAFRAEGSPTAEIRRNRMDRLALAILERADDLTQALAADFGRRSSIVSMNFDVLSGLTDFEHVRADFEEWMQSRDIEGSAERGLPTHVEIQPRGVVGVIAPWNFPVVLAFTPTLEALAAGNRVMIKFSEVTPRTAEVFAEAISAHFDPEEVLVVRGNASTASAFSALPFDHLFFTGSTRVGQLVATAAAANFVPIILELGGKNPAVVGDDADPADAGLRVASARMGNSGQICLCPDDVYVPRAFVESFIEGYRAGIRRFFPTVLHNPDYVSSVDEANFDRVVALVEDARAKGAHVEIIAPVDELPYLPDREMRIIAPTVLTGVTSEMSIWHAEIFGPVLAVHAYDDLAEAIETIGTKPHPLVSFWYGPDSEHFQDFLAHTTSGGVTRNDMNLTWGVDGAPFGGIGLSGNGSYHGRSGFDAFSHHRTIVSNTLPFGIGVVSSPPLSSEHAVAVQTALTDALERTRGRLSA